MPYIITTETPSRLDHQGVGPTVDRRAVATLDEARDAVRGFVFGHIPIGEPVPPIVEGSLIDPTMGLGGDGGTIGPLPDGTVIEVERVDQFELAGLAHWPMDYEGRRIAALKANLAAIIAAYNGLGDKE